MNTKIERKFYCFLMKTFCVETNYKNLYGWGVWAVIADDNDRLKTELINIKKDLSVANTHITKLEKQTDGATAKMMQAIEERSNLKGQVEALEKSLKAITLSSEKSKK